MMEAGNDSTENAQDGTEKRRMAREWLDSCGLRYRAAPNAQQQEQERRGDNNMLLTERHIDSTVSSLCNYGGTSAETYYQSMYASELESDKALVANVCPLFVLHAMATMLQRGDEAGIERHQSQEWMLVLYCLNVKLAQKQQQEGNGNGGGGGSTPTISFLVRLFDLVYQNRAWTPERPDSQALCNVIATFLCESLQFLVVKHNTHAFACDVSISHKQAVEAIVASNMERLYHRQQRFTGGDGDGLEEFLATSHDIARRILRAALDGWAHFQRSRYGCQEVPLRIVSINTTLYADEMTVTCK